MVVKWDMGVVVVCYWLEVIRVQGMDAGRATRGIQAALAAVRGLMCWWKGEWNRVGVVEALGVVLGVVVAVENQSDGRRQAWWVFIESLGWEEVWPWNGHEKARRVRDRAGGEIGW
jgi:hypothetical protein